MNLDEPSSRYVIEYTPRWAVESAARVRGWKAWSDKPASEYVDPNAFARIKIEDSLAAALAFAQELCARGAAFFDQVEVQQEVRQRDDWRAVRSWTVSASGPDEARGREISR